MRNDGIRPSVEIVVLERLASLEQEGILTDDELAAAKAKLVGTG